MMKINEEFYKRFNYIEKYELSDELKDKKLIQHYKDIILFYEEQKINHDPSKINQLDMKWFPIQAAFDLCNLKILEYTNLLNELFADE